MVGKTHRIAMGNNDMNDVWAVVLPKRRNKKVYWYQVLHTFVANCSQRFHSIEGVNRTNAPAVPDLGKSEH